MLLEAQQEEDAAERPHVDQLANLLVAVQVGHLGRAVCQRRVLCDALLLLDQLLAAALDGQPLRRRTAKVAQHELLALRREHVLELQVAVSDWRELRVHQHDAAHDRLEYLEDARLRQRRAALEVAVLALFVQQVDQRAERAKLEQHPVLSVASRARQLLGARPKVADDARLVADLLEHADLHLGDLACLTVLRQHLFHRERAVLATHLPCRVDERVATLGEERGRAHARALALPLEVERERREGLLAGQLSEEIHVVSRCSLRFPRAGPTPLSCN